MEVLLNYFPHLTPLQIQQFQTLYPLYLDWNSKINVVSRKDIEELYTRHVLHSLGIAKVISFQPNTKIVDVGTGGGFPGIPLAILFPECQFHLIDVIGKKIKVVNEVAHSIGLKNIKATQIRAENLKDTYDFVVSRAVTNMTDFVQWVQSHVKKNSKNELPNGILYLKGGDLSEELAPFPNAKLYDLSSFFSEDFFETKKVVYLPL